MNTNKKLVIKKVVRDGRAVFVFECYNENKELIMSAEMLTLVSTRVIEIELKGK